MPDLFALSRGRRGEDEAAEVSAYVVGGLIDRRSRHSDDPQKRENDDNEQETAQASRGIVTPARAIGPSGQSAQQQKNDDHDQKGSGHVVLVTKVSELADSCSEISASSVPSKSRCAFGYRLRNDLMICESINPFR